MKIYVAAPYAARPMVAEFLGQIAAAGHEPICRWADGTHPVGQAGNASEATLDERITWGEDDLEDIDRSHAVIVFTAEAAGIPPEQATSGGRHIETGYAIGKGKLVILVGQPENIFHWLPEVYAATDGADALDTLDTITRIRTAAGGAA